MPHLYHAVTPWLAWVAGTQGERTPPPCPGVRAQMCEAKLLSAQLLASIVELSPIACGSASLLVVTPTSEGEMFQGM